MIKVAPRAQITPDFKDLYIQAVTRKMRQLKDRLETLSPRQRQLETVRLGPALGRMSDILKGVRAPGRGLDDEVTQLRALPGLEKFGVAEAGEQTFFVGLTREVRAEELGHGSSCVGYWDLGRYRICVSMEGLLNARMGEIHLIPERAPFTEARHFHHRAHQKGSASPLLWDAYTCWSQFGTPVGAAVQAMNVPELYRLLFIFVNRYYNGSPLVRFSDMTFAKRTQ